MMTRVTAPTRWPEARATRGMVAAPHVLATEAGRAMFTAGGNALDAAIAAAATIAVVYPHMNSIGGDNFWLIYDARAGRLRALNACGRSAAAVDAADQHKEPKQSPERCDAENDIHDHRASCADEHRAFAPDASRDALGSPIPWKRLLEDAVRHARDGFAVSPGQRRVTAGADALFAASAPAEVRSSFWPVYHPDRFADGRFVQADLAATLAAVSEGGDEEFYRGDLARRIVAGAHAVGSPLTLGDLAEHRADWVEPLRVRYRDGEATSFPPPTQGFAALAILALLDGFDVANLDDADYVHVIVEATKLAFEDRDRYLADPTMVTVPVERCLDAARLARRRSRISRRAAIAVGGPPADGDTIAIVTADAQGNAVSVIQSTYHEFGAAVVAGGTGVLLQNRGAFFSLDPGHPNALAPRKRTAHTLIPSIYMVGGRPRFVYGTMGGEGQPQTQAALVTRLVDRGLGPQAAVEAPRWLYGRTWGEPSKALRLESRFGDTVATALGQRGHDVRVVEPWSDLMGHAQCIALADGALVGGSDPRADGAALGCSSA